MIQYLRTSILKGPFELSAVAVEKPGTRTGRYFNASLYKFQAETTCFKAVAGDIFRILARERKHLAHLEIGKTNIPVGLSWKHDLDGVLVIIYLSCNVFLVFFFRKKLHKVLIDYICNEILVLIKC